MAASQENMDHVISIEQAGTLDGLFAERVTRSAQQIAYQYFDQQSEQWCTYTWAEMDQAVARWQAALSAEALIPGDRVAVMIRNCPEWVMFEQAAMGLGLVVVPLYTDDRAENVSYTLIDAGVKLLVLEDMTQWHALDAARDQTDALQRVVMISACEDGDQSLKHNLLVSMMDWLPEESGAVKHVNTDSSQLASIIYTSGTSGRPKGVMLSHHNMLSNAYGCLQIIPVWPADVLLSFLPLSHTFERTAGYYVPMMSGASIAYVRSIPQLQEDLLTIRPTLLVSVPRIYERVYAGIQAKLAEGSSFSKALFEYAVATGYSRFKHQQNRGPWRLSHLLWPLLDKLVASKVKQKLGGRLRQAFCGGAPLSAEVSRIFIGLGIPILQGYGMTETSPVVCANRTEDNVPSSVGRTIPGVSVKLGENNALLVQGPNVMLGYWNNQEATQAILSSDGWLNSGDVASIDEQGRVTITGRLKEIIVLSTGEKVPPADMEAAIMRDPLFEQVLLIGEARSYLSVLVVLNAQELEKLAEQEQFGIDLKQNSAAQQEKIEAILLEKITVQTKEFPGYACVRRVAALSEPWTVENEMLTPTLKLRRAKILNHYKAEVEQLYVRY